MKRKYIFLAIPLFCITALLSCEKTAVQLLPTTAPAGAMVRYYNFAVNAPVVNYYANDVKVSGAISATGAESSTAGLTYGTVFPASNYAPLTPGAYTLKAQLPSTVAADPNKVVTSLSATLADGKFYSVFASGIYDATAKTSDSFMLEDVLPALDTSAAYVRFVNVVPNGTGPMNLTVKHQTSLVVTTIGTNIAYKAGSTFIKVPTGVYTLSAAYTAVPATEVIGRTDVSFLKARVYTIGARGNITIAYVTGNNGRFLDNTTNR